MSVTYQSNLNKFQKSGFRVVIDRENYGTTEFMAYTVQHPDLSLPSALVTFRNAKAHIPGDTADFSQLAIELHVDEEFKSYHEMLSWICRNVDGNFVPSISRNDDIIPSMADISVPLLNSANNKMGIIKYSGCTPTNITGLELTSVDEGIEYSTFTVTFDITKFELILD
jgi:hypothetical protein